MTASTRIATARFWQAAMLALTALAAACLPAAASQIVVFVNGQPITSYDIEQRTRLNALGGRKAPSRQEVLDDLIDDKLKLSAGKLYSMSPSQAEMDTAFANVARNVGTTPENFAKGLQAAGINPSALKARLGADMIWAQIIRGRFGQNLQVGEKDVLAALETRDKDSASASFEYQLRPILFVLPRGSGEAAIEARKRDVDALRARFFECEQGVALARGLRDVVVKDPVRRNSADLSEQLRNILDKVEIGRLTPPEVTSGGVEVFALCSKKQSTADSPMKKAIRDELFSAKFTAQAQRYLKELRAGAMIEYK